MPDQTGLNIIFAGTPEFAKHHLAALIKSHHRVVCVYTQPDRPAGRGKKLQTSPVKQLALEADIEIQQPLSLKNIEAQNILADYNADIMVVVAYGLLLPKAVLDAPRFGCINVHGSILPKWRGAAPIQRAIESGDKESGITIMQMDVGLDTGDMLTKTFCPIQEDDTASSLHDRLAHIGPKALLNALNQINSGSAIAEAQNNHLATYAHKLSKQEAELDWTLSADVLERRIRAFNPFPIATTLLGEARLRIHSATANPIFIEQTSNKQAPGTIISHKEGIVVACGENTSICIKRLQLPGKKAISSEDVLNGSAEKFKLGTVFSRKTPNK